MCISDRAGHSGGSFAHDTAVNSLAVHLAAAFVWCGGLAAILLLWPLLTTAAGVVVRRYSVLAAWCFFGIAGSGFLNGMVRVGELEGLTSPYGVLLIVKTILLVALGLAGLGMRQRIVGRLEEAQPAGTGAAGAVSYTHLDVYKRQERSRHGHHQHRREQRTRHRPAPGEPQQHQPGEHDGRDLSLIHI